MFLIRRAALRATLPSAQARGIVRASPFGAGVGIKSSFSTSVFRRYSDDAEGRSVGSSGGDSGYGSDRQPRQYGGDRGGYGGGNGGYGDRRGGFDGSRDMNSGFRNNTRPNKPPPAPCPTVYIGNLLFDVTAEDLTRDFTAFGTVKSAIIASDARGMSKGFGYVEFESTEQATAAIEAKHQTIFEGRRLVVNYQVQKSHSSFGDGTGNPPSKTLFIGNLAFEMSDADLNKLFREIRNVTDVRVAIDRRTGQPRGFAHADFVDVESATKGKEILAGKEVYGRNLRVDYSASQSASTPRSLDG